MTDYIKASVGLTGISNYNPLTWNRRSKKGKSGTGTRGNRRAQRRHLQTQRQTSQADFGFRQWRTGNGQVDDPATQIIHDDLSTGYESSQLAIVGTTEGGTTDQPNWVDSSAQIIS
jgi:hypothetical protein